MAADHRDVDQDHAPPGGTATRDSGVGRMPPMPGPASRGSVGKMAIAGLLAAVIAAVIVNTWYPFFQAGLSFGPGAVANDEQRALLTRYRWQNSAAVFAGFGLLLGASLGLAGGWRRAALACISGAAGGAIFGGLANWCAMALADQSFARVIDPAKPYHEIAKWTIVHATAWTLVGLGVGFGCSLPWATWRDVGRGTVAAALGGLLAAPCFQIFMTLIEVIAPIGGTDALIPDRGIGQFVWMATAAVLIGVAMSLTQRPAAPILSRTDRV